LASTALFILAQSSAAFSGGVLGVLSHTSGVAMGVLLLLAVFSLVSWAIILYKGISLQRAHSQSKTFLEVFRKSTKFSEVNSVCVQLQASPLVGVFQAGYQEVNQQVRGTGKEEKPGGAAARPTVRSLESLSRALVRAATGEVTRLERRVTFLATTASVTPFIGLFGTVWGIMSAFEQIGVTGSTSLQAVGTPIAEALIATAAGLAAAIPAVLFYNYLSQRVKLFASEMDDFAMEFLNISERNFT
jgi:biopolymer transport protein TolQ